MNRGIAMAVLAAVCAVSAGMTATAYGAESTLAAVCAVSAGMTATAYGAESTFAMKKKVVSLLGILTTSDRNAEVTREEFAGMLVKASSQRQSYGAAVTAGDPDHQRPECRGNKGGICRDAGKSLIPETELWSGSHRRGVCRRGCRQPVRLRHPDGILQRVDERLSGRQF